MSREEIKLLERLAEKLGTAKALVLAEEFARELADRMSERMPRPERFVTRILDRKNVEIPMIFSPIDTTVRGRLEELMIVSATSDFGLLVERDGKLEINRKFSELAEISPYLKTIDAFQTTNGKYVVRLGEIAWLRTFRIEIFSPRTIRFDHLFAKWQEALA